MGDLARRKPQRHEQGWAGRGSPEEAVSLVECVIEPWVDSGVLRAASEMSPSPQLVAVGLQVARPLFVAAGEVSVGLLIR